MGLSLLEECRGWVVQALSALGPAANRDSRREMQLQAALGASLLFTNGSTSEIERACTTAFRLAESLGDTEYQLRALWGLWVYRNHCGEYSAALAVAQRFYTLAREHADPNDRLSGERMIGVSHHYLGDQTEARSHLERTLSDYVDPQRRSPFIRLRYDQKVAGQVMLARTVWLQGFADQAWRTVQRAIGDAEALANSATYATPCATAAAWSRCGLEITPRQNVTRKRCSIIRVSMAWRSGALLLLASKEL